LSALAYLAAIIVSICRIRRLSHPGISRWYWILPLVSLFFLLEEISFGYNFIKYFKRKNIRGVNIDAVHDFIGVASNLIHDKIPLFVVFLFATIMILFPGFLLFRFRYVIRDKMRKHPVLGYAFLAAVCGFAATVIDLPLLEENRPKFGFLVFIEEMMEFFMAVSILFAAYAVPFSQHGNSHHHSPEKL
ncbi:hypothetical protein JW926_09590, partial [Candidatus Sumerlaeota bacterium]|nr:hypothetical protein [Candidatus Sumerlaeota bacterium]